MAQGPRRRTQAERRAETHEALLRAAVSVIARKGFEQASLQDIANAAGLSKGALHYHFRTKHQLVEPVVARCVERLRTAVTPAWNHAQSPGERIRTSVRTMWHTRLEQSEETLTLMNLLACSIHDSRVRTAVATAFRQTERELTEPLERTVAEAGLHPRIPLNTIPRLLLALLDGLTLQHMLLGETETDPSAALETLAASLFTL